MLWLIRDIRFLIDYWQFTLRIDENTQICNVMLVSFFCSTFAIPFGKILLLFSSLVIGWNFKRLPLSLSDTKYVTHSCRLISGQLTSFLLNRTSSSDMVSFKSPCISCSKPKQLEIDFRRKQTDVERESRVWYKRNHKMHPKRILLCRILLFFSFGKQFSFYVKNYNFCIIFFW